MTMQAFEDDDDELMTEINMTPFIDVMLVLLIVFLVAIPAIHHAIKIDLPRVGTNAGTSAQIPAHANVSIRADGTLLWNDAPVTQQALAEQIRAAANSDPQTELHLEADRLVPYERVAEVMSMAQAGGLTRIGFITVPKRK
ncbi:biopolymer transporter ExbD [Trinickia sp. LjRoot230]|uniref:ExbD/TolR family protein n=1 Tax=Trinickia sp. LjRoot230 TaxID=3342288 RepID=UPI003ECD729F